MNFVFNDGGRKTAGYKGSAGDCAVRAIAIVSGIPYKMVYDEINILAKSEKMTKRHKKQSSARNGVHIKTIKRYLDSKGFIWIPTMFIGSGCTVHVKAAELPKGKIILNLSKHITAVIDGVIHDTYDCSRNETRCVYGYWMKQESFAEYNVNSKL